MYSLVRVYSAWFGHSANMHDQALTQAQAGFVSQTVVESGIESAGMNFVTIFPKKQHFANV